MIELTRKGKSLVSQKRKAKKGSKDYNVLSKLVKNIRSKPVYLFSFERRKGKIIKSWWD